MAQYLIQKNFKVRIPGFLLTIHFNEMIFLKTCMVADEKVLYLLLINHPL